MAARDIIQAAGGSAATSAAVYVEDVFSTYVYAGTGSNQTLTTGIDLSTNGGMIWSKRRSAIENNFIQDTVRGLTARLVSNATTAQTSSGSWPMSSVSTTGMTVSGISYAAAGETYASWVFRKQPKFFDVVTFTGNGVAGKQIAHSLGATPGMIIVKCTNTSGVWYVYHKSLPSSYGLLNSTAAFSTFSAQTIFGNNTTTVAPTSSVFTVGTDSTMNNSGDTYVAYLFADSNSGGFGSAGTDSVVACGTFTADASRNAVVNLGWEPQYLLMKRTDGADNWYVFDVMRGWSMTGYSYISPDSSSSDSFLSTAYVIPTATGFTWQNSGLGGGASYIYMAIRRGPMKTPTDATKVFAPVTRTGTGSTTTISATSFPPDTVIVSDRNRNYSQYTTVIDRLRGTAPVLETGIASGEVAYSTSLTSYNMDGITVGTSTDGRTNYSGVPYINWFFRRAPGFFDVVCYTGTGSARTVAHNLGVAPELMIVKSRSDAGYNWWVQSSLLGATSYILLDNSSGAGTGVAVVWNSTNPNATVFSLGTYSQVNSSGSTYVAYLFATCPGVSKVGSYTGSGTTKQIDCGFAAGARFVLIKRTDSTGDWLVADTARGLVSGNDPLLKLNSTAAEVTTLDWIDPYSAGFEVVQESTANANVSGASYIYLAVA